jgi:TonB family protein
MGLRRLRYLASICLLIPVLGYSYLPAKTVIGVTQNPGWTNFTPPDEEFTVSVPGNPVARIHPVYNARDSSAEKLLAHREYGGYGSGLIFIIHSFKAEHPQKLSSNYPNFLQQGMDFERNLSIDGLDSTEVRRTVTSPRGTYTKRNVKFVTGKHLYLMTMATIEENSLAVDQFLSSIRWHRADNTSTPIQPPVETVTGAVFNPSELTQRALVVSKAEPFYTDDARAHKVTGTIILEAVFAEDGYVTNITVTRGLPHGLIESAIDAARSIRFFPAQKDGKPVSQRTMLEYNFNLY